MSGAYPTPHDVTPDNVGDGAVPLGISPSAGCHLWQHTQRAQQAELQCADMPPPTRDGAQVCAAIKIISWGRRPGKDVGGRQLINTAN